MSGVLPLLSFGGRFIKLNDKSAASLHLCSRFSPHRRAAISVACCPEACGLPALGALRPLT